MNKKIIIYIFAITITTALVIFGVFAYSSSIKEPNNITNYEQCAAAGGRIQESYPPKCVTDDGQSFVQVIE